MYKRQAVAAIGAGGHISAKETNERAQEVAQDAEELYRIAKVSLDSAQNKTEETLLVLGNTKKQVLESSIRQFLQAYDRIKTIQFNESTGLNEISNFSIDPQGAIQLREMSDIYQSSFSSGATGAATGAVIALAASGSLPVVTGTLSVAGSALLVGEVGAAAGLVGSALSFGAAMTPLAAIAAPIVLFTGISSSIKADENLEKAQTMYAEAELASEEMKIAEILCDGISERSLMFNSLLIELNSMFSVCTQLLDNVIRKKTGFLKGKTVEANKLTEEELKLIAVTRALAGAVKAVIDTPMLDEGGKLSEGSQEVYDNTTQKLPKFKEVVSEVESYDFKVKAVAKNGPVNKENKGKRSLLSFKGSIGRKGFLICNVLYLFILSFAAVVGSETIAGLTFIVYMYALLALIAKRLRDLDSSPWFVLMFLIPVVNVLFYLILFFKKSKS